MLRRKPTALTVTSEDIAVFEDQLAKNALPFQQRQQSKSDPKNQTTHSQGQSGQAYTQNAQSAAAAAAAAQAASGYIDPNDELKPLPGERARIVRTREERIMGRD